MRRMRWTERHTTSSYLPATLPPCRPDRPPILVSCVTSTILSLHGENGYPIQDETDGTQTRRKQRHPTSRSPRRRTRSSEIPFHTVPPFSRRPIPSIPSVRSHLLSKQLCDQVEALRQPGPRSLPSPFSSIATIHALGTSGRAFSSPATPRLRFQCAGPPPNWLRSAWPRKWASRNRNRNRNRQDWSRQDRNQRIKDQTGFHCRQPPRQTVRCISTSVQLHGSHIHCQPLSGKSSASNYSTPSCIASQTNLLLTTLTCLARP
ncbi:hypothetical protein B0T13DRAFT_17850 [Neurospora crassa]|nr:hypothetical protein B0T13DRAFT_17850 [Neurospora crassa]